MSESYTERYASQPYVERACRRLSNKFTILRLDSPRSAAPVSVSLSLFLSLPLSSFQLVSPICQVEGKQLGDGSRARECRCMFSDSSAITERQDGEHGSGSDGGGSGRCGGGGGDSGDGGGGDFFRTRIRTVTTVEAEAQVSR